MTNIIVTTPSKYSRKARAEAEYAKVNPGSFYFRSFRKLPTKLGEGTKVFYIEDGYIRGYAVVSEVKHVTLRCDVTNFQLPNSYQAIMPADTWKWIKPIKRTGFRGWRYFNEEVKVVGDWLDPKPEIS